MSRMLTASNPTSEGHCCHWLYIDNFCRQTHQLDVSRPVFITSLEMKLVGFLQCSITWLIASTHSHIQVFASECKKLCVRIVTLRSGLHLIQQPFFHNSHENSSEIALYSTFTNASKILGRILLIINFLTLHKGAEINP